jgi:hypothetical protein
MEESIAWWYLHDYLLCCPELITTCVATAPVFF